MKTFIVALMILLSIMLTLTGCFGNSAPTDDPVALYTDEEIWKYCVESIEEYFGSDSFHISENTVLTLGDAELCTENTQWCQRENYYAEYLQNGDLRFYRFQMNGNLYAKYGEGEWSLAATDSTEDSAYQNIDLDETDIPDISWEMTEDQIRVTCYETEAQAGNEEIETSATNTYIFDLEWNLIQIDTVLVEPSTDAMGEIVKSVVQRTIICHDTDDAAVAQVLDRVLAQVTPVN